MKILKNYEPIELFSFFEDICAIPHQSAYESEIADYLVEFATARSLECYRDEWHNVIIKKAPSKGRENVTPVILQGHTDMVCEKNDGTVHDFLKDGLKLRVDDDILTADGTTLGADNGVAVALMLAILDDNTLDTPPLECVFTSQEEIGLIGANNLDFSQLKGKTLINLDSEEEGVATVSCAAGMRVRLSKNISFESKNDSDGLLLQVRGLSGGHSGMQIQTGVENANHILGRFLLHLSENDIGFALSSINGGNKDNAIPREADALISLENPAQLEQAKSLLEQFATTIKNELKVADPNFSLVLSTAGVEQIIPSTVTSEIVNLLVLAPNGVFKRTESFVISSSNMGIVSLEDNYFKVVFAPRSSIESLQEDIKSKFRQLAKILNFDIKIDSEYPGWEYAQTSKIRDIFVECFKTQTGEELKIEAIHAGLECGLFAKNIPNLDAIAVGPNIKDCHTPQESLELKSFERFYKLLISVLANI